MNPLRDTKQLRGLGALEALLFHPDRRVMAATRAGLLLCGAAGAALFVSVLGPLYGPAALIVLLAGLLMLSDIRWGFLALFAIVGVLPFGALPFKIGFTPTFLDVGLGVVYLVWIVRVATRRDRELLGTSLGPAVLFFLLMALFSFANGLRYSRPSVTTIRNFAELMLAIMFFFVLVNTLKQRGDLEFMARLVMVTGAVASAIGIIFYVIPEAWTIRILDALARFNYPGGAGALRYIEDDAANPMRAIGTMVDPNVLGGFMILAAGLVAPQVVSPRPLLRRSWVALFLGLALMTLYLTYSRGSLFGLAAGLLLVGVLRYRKLLLLAIVGAALLLLLPPAQAYVAHLIEGLQLQDRATLMRLGEYKDAFSLISRYPLLGVGFGGSPDADLYVGVSNLYLLMAEIMGVVGVLVFLVVIAGYFANLWRAWRRVTDPGLEALLLGLAAAIFGALVGGIFDHYLFNLVYPHMSVMLWTYLGMGMVAVRLIEAGDPSRQSGQLRPN